MSYEDIKILEQQLKDAKTNQANMERNCNHQWSEVKYDPEKFREEYLTGEYETQGVHMWPKTSFRDASK